MYNSINMNNCLGIDLTKQVQNLYSENYQNGSLVVERN